MPTRPAGDSRYPSGRQRAYVVPLWHALPPRRADGLGDARTGPVGKGCSDAGGDGARGPPRSEVSAPSVQLTAGVVDRRVGGNAEVCGPWGLSRRAPRARRSASESPTVKATRTRPSDRHSSGSPDVPYYYTGQRPELVAVAPRDRRRALELGCGVGAFAAEFLKVNPRVEYWGVEPFPPAAAEARHRLKKVLERPVEQVYDDLPDAYFDLLVCNDVLEHMANPEAVLRALLEKLEPGGLLFASVPNVRFLPVLVDLLVKKDWRYRDAGVLDRTHLRFYTEKSLRRMIAA